MNYKLKAALGVIVWLAMTGNLAAEVDFTKLVREIRPRCRDSGRL